MHTALAFRCNFSVTKEWDRDNKSSAKTFNIKVNNKIDKTGIYDENPPGLPGITKFSFILAVEIDHVNNFKLSSG